MSRLRISDEVLRASDSESLGGKLEGRGGPGPGLPTDSLAGPGPGADCTRVTRSLPVSRVRRGAVGSVTVRVAAGRTHRQAQAAGAPGLAGNVRVGGRRTQSLGLGPESGTS
jgi:hypothetical protein